MLEHRASAEVSASHPCLEGHFPGDPVVPAVLMLERVLDAVRAWQGPEWRIRRMPAAKFPSPLRPGERFEIVLKMRERRLDFRCERDARLLAQGTWEMETE